MGSNVVRDLFVFFIRVCLLNQQRFLFPPLLSSPLHETVQERGLCKEALTALLRLRCHSDLARKLSR
jgi:hypothetical protein